MNTSTRVEFGLYDVTARSDSAPVTEDAKDFCNLSKDLLLESVPNQNKYGTLETRQWLMDGSFLFFPETPRQYFWGFWSTEQSNGNGAFANPPVLNIRFDKNHSSSGLTLHFYSPTDDWASKVKIQWYDANDGLLAVTMFTPDAVDYYCAHKVENYRRIQLMFLETNKPGRYLKLAGIDYGVYLHFSGEEIIKAHVLEECDPLSAEVSINTLNLTLFNQEGRFSILNPEGYFDVLQHRQKLTVWEDVRRSAHDTSTTSYCMGTFYLDDWSNEDDTLADFTAIDTIGLLDGSPFDGGVYDTHVASLAAEILSGYPYTLDTVLGEERIQGYIPAGTRREALQQLAFAIGAVVDCSRGEIIRIVPAPQRASGLIGTDRRLQDGSKVTLLTLAVCAKQVNGEGKVQHEWHSRIGTGTVYDGIEASAEDIGGFDLRAYIQQTAAEVRQAVQDAAASAKNAETQASDANKAAKSAADNATAAKKSADDAAAAAKTAGDAATKVIEEGVAEKLTEMQNIQKDVSTKAQTAETAAKNAGTAKTAAQNAQNAAEKSAGNAANSESAAKTSAEQAAAARDTAQELAGRVTVDDTLSDASASPVQNKVIFAALAKKQDVQRVTFVINDTDGGLDAVVAD